MSLLQSPQDDTDGQVRPMHTTGDVTGQEASLLRWAVSTPAPTSGRRNYGCLLNKHPWTALKDVQGGGAGGEGRSNWMKVVKRHRLAVIK